MTSELENYFLQKLLTENNIYELKSVILSLTAISNDLNFRSKIFYNLLEICFTASLEENNEDKSAILKKPTRIIRNLATPLKIGQKRKYHRLSGDSDSSSGVEEDGSNFQGELLRLFHNEIQILFHGFQHDSAHSCHQFWNPIEQSLLNYPDNHHSKNSPMAWFISTLSRTEQLSVYERCLKRASEKCSEYNPNPELEISEETGQEKIVYDLEHLAKLILKFTTISEEKLPDYLKDLCDKLIKEEKPFSSIENLQKQWCSSSNKNDLISKIFSISNFLTKYRQIFIFDVCNKLIKYQATPASSINSNSQQDVQSAMFAKKKTLYYKYFRKAVEYGISMQLFIIQGFLSEDNKLNRSKQDRENDDVFCQFWKTIDQLRKNIGSLTWVAWQPEKSTSGDLLALFRDLVRLINSEDKLEKNFDKDCSIVPTPNYKVSLQRGSVKMKQIFYTCLQMVIQAATGYCLVVEPLLIFGTLDAYRRNQNIDQNEEKFPIPILPVKNETLAIINKLNPSQNPITNTSLPLPKKFNCNPDKLLKIFYHCSNILENVNLCSDDWEKQIKKKWHPEANPSWVLAKSVLEFQNGEYDSCLETLENFRTGVSSVFGKTSHENLVIEETLVLRITIFKLLAGIELKNFTFIKEAGCKLLNNFHNQYPKLTDILPEKSICLTNEKNQITHFQLGKDFVRRATFSSILYGQQSIVTEIKMEDNRQQQQQENDKLTQKEKINNLKRQTFIIIGSQLFMNNDEDNLEILNSKIDNILEKIRNSVLVEEDDEDATKLKPNFNFIELLENINNVELLERIQDCRIVWKERYCAAKKEYLKVGVCVCFFKKSINRQHFIYFRFFFFVSFSHM